MAIKPMATTEKPLQSLRVLVTRPAERADTLMAAIKARGGEAVHIPLLKVVALDERRDAAICAATAQLFRELDSYHRIIAISVNALHFGLPWIKQFWPGVPHQIIWYGIGAATIAAFANYDIVAQGADGAAKNAAMTSEALLAAHDLQNVHGERILILRGVGGREQLAAVLRERGAKVDYAECYRRIEPVLDSEQRAQLQDMAFDAICVNSTETLQNLWQCLDPAAQQRARTRALLVPSARVAAVARKFDFERIIIAANAGTEATLAALMTMRV